MDNFHKKILYKATHRGMKELDFILGSIARAFNDVHNIQDLQELSALLEKEDMEIWDWLTGKREILESIDPDFLRRIKELYASLLY